MGGLYGPRCTVALSNGSTMLLDEAHKQVLDKLSKAGPEQWIDFDHYDRTVTIKASEVLYVLESK